MRKLIFVFCLMAIGQTDLFAQAFSINTDGSTANASAMLDVKSTSKGVLIPRMTRTERNAIASPATGLLIFQSGPDSIGFHYYDGTKWTWMFSNANADSLAWRTGGNTGTTDAGNFIGTKDNIPLNIRVNNQKSGRIDNNLANTFLGYQAANANSTGQNNAAFGHQALLSNTSGTNNTAVGALSASGNTSGAQNTATGYASMILNTVGQNNTTYGFYSLYNNVAGSNATAIGYQAMLYANNTTTAFVNNNVALGYEALKGSSTASANTGLTNTALGYQTLLNNSTGAGNTSVGYQSLVANTTGIQNIAIGKTSMISNTTGVNNTAVGVQSLYSNTSGNENSAFGPNSLFFNNGDGNSGFGWSTLFYNSTGNYNTAVGYYASGLNTTGYSNVAVGAKALYTNTTSSNLVAIGDSSLFNSTGTGNTALGSKAGYNLTTGSNNVFIGYQAGYNETGNNKLYIANNATNPPIIYGDFSNKTIGLGTITPNSTYGFAKLEIASDGFGSPSDVLIRNAANSSGYAPGLVFQHARGTLAAPANVTSGDYLNSVGGMNYAGSYVQSWAMDVYADGTVSTGTVPTRIQFATQNLAGGYGYRMTIKNDGSIGIGTASPNSTLQVDGTMAVGVTMNIAGGTSGSPVSLSTAKYYIGLLPADGTNNNYQLPSPVGIPGRTYIIRNNSSVNNAVISTAAALLFPGASATGNSSYTLNPTSTVKTVMVVSDGSNWTIMKMD